MKQLYSIFLLILISFTALAQTQSGDLDYNNTRVKILNGGDFFWDLNSARYEVPKVDDLNAKRSHTIFSGAIWIGAEDPSGNVHLAAMTYRQRGQDFYPGPVSNDQEASNDNYDFVWKIDRRTVDEHLDDFKSNGSVSNPDPAIKEWPAHGDTTIGEPYNLAPFVDHNQNGTYDPENGDYPCFPGEVALYCIYNANGLHTETGGNAMKIDVHQLFYQETPGVHQGRYDEVNLAQFKIVNRSATTYSNVKVGLYIDFDIGNYADDFIGCDSATNMIFGYNGDDNDEGALGYGYNPPAQNMMFLNKRLYAGTYYNNNANPINGNPVNASDYYNYLCGKWKNGNPFNYGGDGITSGTYHTRYMFSGDVDSDNSWTEINSQNIPADRRFLGTAWPFDLAPGESECVDVAFVYAREDFGGPKQAVKSMKQLAEQVQQRYDQNTYGWKDCNCGQSSANVADIEIAKISIYPNPADESISIVGDLGDFELINSLGEVISRYESTTKHVDLSNLPSGVYFIRSAKGSKKIIKL